MTQDDSKTGVSRSNGKVGKFFWALVVVACALVLLRYCFKSDSPTGEKSGPVEGQISREEVAKLRADINGCYTQFDGRVNAIVEKYQRMLPLPAAASHFETAREGADFIASREGLCGFKVCAVLAYKMAYDKFKKTNRAQEAIEPVVTSRIVEPLLKAAEAYSKWENDFRQELQKEDQALAFDLASKSHAWNQRLSADAREEARKIDDALDKLGVDVRKHALVATPVLAGVVVDAALVKSSCVAVKGIVVRGASRSLLPIATRMGVAAGSAAASAAADGPLPIGDVVGALITVGGLAWTAHEIYKVTQKMPAEMRRDIMTSIDDFEKAIRKASVENFKSDRAVCLRTAEARVQELCQIIGK